MSGCFRDPIKRASFSIFFIFDSFFRAIIIEIDKYRHLLYITLEKSKMGQIWHR